MDVSKLIVEMVGGTEQTVTFHNKRRKRDRGARRGALFVHVRAVTAIDPVSRF